MKLRSFISLCLGMLFYTALIVSYADTRSTTPAAEFSDPAKSILVAKTNPQFTITLASNPTTGYSWHLLNYDKQLITLVNHAYQRPTKDMPGAGGKEVWTFKVKDTGFIAPHASKITLLYARPWNIKDNSKQVEFTVATS